MKLQKDFLTEVTLLEFHTTQLGGVKLDCSPKFHPEVASKGIVYAWALSEIMFFRAFEEY